jgi:hypothetical protein
MSEADGTGIADTGGSKAVAEAFWRRLLTASQRSPMTFEGASQRGAASCHGEGAQPTLCLTTFKLLQQQMLRSKLLKTRKLLGQVRRWQSPPPNRSLKWRPLCFGSQVGIACCFAVMTINCNRDHLKCT